MKKVFFVSAIVAGFFMSGVGVSAVKAEEYKIDPIGDEIGSEDGRSDVMDPVVAKDGPEDGLNDESSVQPKIRKISDDISLFSLLGAGEWDYLGSSTFKTRSKTFYSGGGDLGIQISQPYIGPGFTWQYKLVEEDPVINDTVSRFTLANQKGTYEVVFNVRSFVDGDNKKAELHLEKLTNPATSVSTKWWD
ncbi:hypothetical protein [Bacillus velezensis]|uniref:hypothetical protein n=1 Tax=Bacillus velezensis TaxID=492670 RepID=UPI003CFC65D6